MSKEIFKQIMEGVREGIQAAAPGLSLDNILQDVGAEMKRLGVQGQMEAASALFNGNAFVPYGPGQYTPHEQTHGLPVEAMKQPEVQQEQERGGMSM